MKRSIAIALVLSCFGIWLRYETLVQRPLDSDERYQLNQMLGDQVKPFWTHLHYGDHTSWPGEYLLHYPVLYKSGIKTTNVDAASKGGYKWRISIIHILMMLGSYWLMFLLLRGRTWIAYFIAFWIFNLNVNLIYYSLQFRPYAALIFFGLLSLYLQRNIPHRGNLFSIVSIFILFFIFNYHAYGILIVLLPMIYFLMFQDCRWNNNYVYTMLKTCVISFPIWCWYALGNSFGMAPNKMQTVCDTFQFIKVHSIQNAVAGSLFGDNTIIQILMPVIFLVLLSSRRHAHWYWLLFLIVIPIFLILLIDIKTQYWFIQRQWVFVMPWFALLCGGLIEDFCIQRKDNSNQFFKT